MAEGDVGEAGIFCGFTGALQHGGGHIYADDAAGGAYALGGDEGIEAAAAADIEYGFAGAQGGHGKRVAAAEAELGGFARHACGVLVGIAAVPGDVGDVFERNDAGAAAGTAFGAAGGIAEGTSGVVLLNRVLGGNLFGTGGDKDADGGGWGVTILAGAIDQYVDQAGLLEPVTQVGAVEAEPGIGHLGSQLFVSVGIEVGDGEAAAGAKQAGHLFNGSERVGTVVQHHVGEDDIEAGGFKREGIGGAEVVGDVGVGGQVLAGNLQHLGRGIYHFEGANQRSYALADKASASTDIGGIHARMKIGFIDGDLAHGIAEETLLHRLPIGGDLVEVVFCGVGKGHSVSVLMSSWIKFGSGVLSRPSRVRVRCCRSQPKPCALRQ